MGNIDFYYVDYNLINILQKVETDSRGFTRVPNMLYDKSRKQKFVCGVVLKINGFNYYAPISHYKISKPNNILINIKSDKINPIKGSIRFNYMFPVPDKHIKNLRINALTDVKEKNLLNKELKFCRQNQQTIENIALKTYLEVVHGTNENLKYNSCDFALLENTLRNLSQQSPNKSLEKSEILV